MIPRCLICSITEGVGIVGFIGSLLSTMGTLPKYFLEIYIIRYIQWCYIQGNLLSQKKVLVVQSCPTPCKSMDCSPPGSSVHGIFQARILEWLAISFSRGSSWSRDRTRISCTAGRLYHQSHHGSPKNKNYYA